MALVDVDTLDIARIELRDSQPTHHDAVHVLSRWTDTSPLCRAAAAALHHAETTGHSANTLWVQSQTVGVSWSRDFHGSLWISFAWRYFNELTYRLREGLEWLEARALVKRSVTCPRRVSRKFRAVYTSATAGTAPRSSSECLPTAGATPAGPSAPVPVPPARATTPGRPPAPA
uniref:Uncharacterized protein n=1 Tax=Streptomyces auratus AGR0001 TaxID=1160718 RepID=J1RE67_9ACTN